MKTALAYLFIDDIRNHYDYVKTQKGDLLVVARTYNAAIHALNELQFNYIFFDNDLGEDKEGYDVAKYIVENNIKIDGFKIQSMNPVGVKNIRDLLTHYGYKELN